MKNLLLLFCFCTAIYTTKAQEDSVVTNSTPIESRVSTLEKIISKLPKISGFINMRYQYSSTDDSHSFDIRRARVDFKGDLSSQLDYRLQIEFANSPKILDAYIRYKIHPYIAVQAGEYKIPFSLENPYGPHTLETIENSMGISKLCNYSDLSGLSANGRDIGITLYGSLIKQGDYNLLDYAFGVFNGNGINLKDNNKNKDFSGILTLHPCKNLSLAGSCYLGKYGKQGEEKDRDRYGAGIKWQDKHLLIRSEYLYGKTGTLKSEGAYAVVGYFVHPKIQPVVKFDYFQEDKSNSQTREYDYLVGLNYYPIKALRLVVNYTYKDVEASKSSHLLALQFFAMF